MKIKAVTEYLNNDKVIVYEYIDEIGKQIEICNEMYAYKKYDIVGELINGELKMTDYDEDEYFLIDDSSEEEDED